MNQEHTTCLQNFLPLVLKDSAMHHWDGKLKTPEKKIPC